MTKTLEIVKTEKKEGYLRDELIVTAENYGTTVTFKVPYNKRQFYKVGRQLVMGLDLSKAK